LLYLFDRAACNLGVEVCSKVILSYPNYWHLIKFNGLRSDSQEVIKQILHYSNSPSVVLYLQLSRQCTGEIT